MLHMFSGILKSSGVTVATSGGSGSGSGPRYRAVRQNVAMNAILNLPPAAEQVSIIIGALWLQLVFNSCYLLDFQIIY